MLLTYKSILENTIDKYYQISGAITGNDKNFYIPKGLSVELVDNNQYLYLLPSVVIDVNFDKNIILVEDTLGRVFRFSLKDQIKHHDGFITFFLSEAPLRGNLTTKSYSIKEGDSHTIKKIFCTNDIVYLVWSDTKPIAYWEDFLQNTDTNRIIKVPRLTINIIRGTERPDLFKEVSTSKYTCI